MTERAALAANAQKRHLRLKAPLIDVLDGAGAAHVTGVSSRYPCPRRVPIKRGFSAESPST